MLLCFISTTFWQCQKEDDLQDGKHFGKNLKTTQTKYLEGEEALKIKNLLNSELEKSNQRIYSKNNSSMRTDYGTIDFSTIMEVIDTIGIKNYTFRIKNHPEEDNDTFFNLVVNVFNEQSLILLMRYDMSENYVNQVEEGIITPFGFEGVITPILIADHPCPQIEEPITISPTNPNNPIGGGGEGPGDPGGQPSQPSQPDAGGEQGNEPVFAEPCGFTVRIACCHGIHYGESDRCKCAEGDKGATYFVSCRTETPQTNTEPCPDLGDVGILLPEDPKTPCSQLKKMSSTTFYQQNIDYLKQQATGEKEYALVYKYFNGTSSFAPPTTAGHNTENPNTVDLSAFKDLEWIGAFHNHTMGDNPTIKMFGPDDIEWLFVKTKKRVKFYQLNNITPIDVSDLFLGLVNENETYCIKIKDWSQFLAFAPKYGEFKEKLEAAFKISGGDASQTQYQKDLLKLLSEYEMGVGLFDQDGNGNWSEINLDPSNPNNTPIKTPCI